MTLIGTNLAAIRSTNGINDAGLGLAAAMERPPTGTRINSAKHDAAGLAVASRMTSQVRGRKRSTRFLRPTRRG